MSRFAVLVEGDHGVVQCLGDGNAARQVRRVGPFGNKPLCRRIDAGLFEQCEKLDTSPFGARYEAVQRLYVCLYGLGRKQRRAVAAAFHKGYAGHLRIASERFEREHQWPLDQAVDQEPVLVRIDIWRAAIRDHEVQAIWRNHPVQHCGMGVSGSVDRYDLPEHVYR